MYRHLRRSEMIRQDYIEKTATAEEKDLEFLQRMAERRMEDEERTAKKRAKRCVPYALLKL